MKSLQYFVGLLGVTSIIALVGAVALFLYGFNLIAKIPYDTLGWLCILAGVVSILMLNLLVLTMGRFAKWLNA